MTHFFVPSLPSMLHGMILMTNNNYCNGDVLSVHHLMLYYKNRRVTMHNFQKTRSNQLQSDSFLTLLEHHIMPNQRSLNRS